MAINLILDHRAFVKTADLCGGGIPGDVRSGERVEAAGRRAVVSSGVKSDKVRDEKKGTRNREIRKEIEKEVGIVHPLRNDLDG